MNRDNVPVHGGAGVYTAISIVPSKETPRKVPSVVCFAIDTSGSMAGSKIEYAKKAAKNFLDGLDRSDYAGIVSFDDVPRTIRECQPISDKTSFFRDIDRMKPGGQTDLHGGLELASTQIRKVEKKQQEACRRIILLSDGKPTVGIDSLEKFKNFSRQVTDYGISITAMGIGDDYNEDLLYAVAMESRGSWYHITSPNEIPEKLSTEFRRMGAVMLPDSKLQIELSKGVNIERILKAEPQVSDISNFERVNQGITFPAGDVAVNEPQKYCIKMWLPERPKGRCRIAVVKLSSGERTYESNVIANYTEDKALYEIENNPFPRELFSLSEYALDAQKAIGDPEKTRVLEGKERQLGPTIRHPELKQRFEDIKTKVQEGKQGIPETRRKEYKQEVVTKKL